MKIELDEPRYGGVLYNGPYNGSLGLVAWGWGRKRKQGGPLAFLF